MILISYLYIPNPDRQHPDHTFPGKEPRQNSFCFRINPQMKPDLFIFLQVFKTAFEQIVNNWN